MFGELSDFDDDDDYDESDWDSYDYDSESTEDDSRHFKEDAQGRKLLAELANQRRAGKFLDVVVQVEDCEFPCHRPVLATISYFKAMLSSNLGESSSKVIQLHGIDGISFCKILDFLYTGEIRISENDVQDILQTAHMLQFDKILKYCCEFIQDNLCPANCLGVMRLAGMYGLSDLKKSARDMAMSNFSDAIQHGEFLSLSVQELLDLLEDEDLKVTNEEEVVNFVIRWLDHAPENRQTATLQILQEIRLTCVKISVLQKLESHPVIRESAECQAKITAAKEKHLLGKKVEGEEASRNRRGTSDNLAIIVGGWMAAKETGLHDETEMKPGPMRSITCFDPDSQQYYHVTNLPTSVSGYMSVASAGRHVYVTGGRACWSLKENRTEKLTWMGPRRKHFQSQSRQAFRYDFPSDTWLKLPDMPRGRAGHHSVIVNGKLFVVGGDAEATSLVTMDCYDPEEGAWIKIYAGPPKHLTSSNMMVTAFGHKIAFICKVAFGSIAWRVSRMSKEIDHLCVHAFDVKTKGWKNAYILLPSSWAEDSVTLSTAVDGRLYIRIGYGLSSGCRIYQYIFDAEKETLSLDEGNKQDFRENFLRTRREKQNVNYWFTNSQDIVDTISNYEFGDHTSTSDHYSSTKQTPLPFALFGHSFLETQKSRVGWYCRDLAALEEEEDERDGSDCN
ncbi:KLHL24 [Branchiostoma lanceolatum]|uniref:KLHL24 protein n=1 Tax=Branchiostoma lanceolatum TaxID=7740 RepID=A0A8K0A064_BRALA|nr:KLHL24 [Branchiostoma lanceolatum]